MPTCLFDVFVSRSLAFVFPSPDASRPSPLTHDGEAYYRLDATFFAWASRVVPRAIASGSAPARYGDVLEDMRLHLARYDPDSLPTAAALANRPGAIPLPS